MNKFHIYLWFADDPESQVNSQDEGRDFLRAIQRLIDRSDCELGALLYYDTENLTNFFSALKLLEQEDLLGYFGCNTAEETILGLLNQSDIQEWSCKPLHDTKESNSYYKEWDDQSRIQIDEILPVLKEIGERESLISGEEKCLLLEVCPSNKGLVSIIRGSRGSLPKLIHIDVISDFLDLDSWFEDNRIPRIFNMTDTRHIENHPDYRHGKSPLLSGIAGRNNAQSFLQSAIGDKRERKYLINIDENNNRVFIRYEDENAINQYHGYHLVKPITHVRDIKAEKEIPERVKELLLYRQEVRDGSR